MTRKKGLLITVILSIFLIISPISVKALDNNYLEKTSSYKEGTVMRLANGDIETDCSGIFTPDAFALSHELLSYFRILAPLLVVIYSAIDFTRAVLGKYDSKEDALETAKIKAGKRLLACLILIFIPTILKVLLNTFGDEIKIDPACVDKFNGS